MVGERLDVGKRRLSYQDVLDLDTKEVPKHIREESRGSYDWTEGTIDRYISRDWHEREKEKIWKRTWQFACREEHIPEVGDHVIYEIAGLQYLVIRSSADEIRAYPNACLHRGRQLKDFDGWCSEIKCPFHGITWSLDGELTELPAGWELPHVNKDNFRLPAISVGTWEGFVFINPDPDAQPLADYLGELGEHFEKWDLGSRRVEAHVSKILRCNWKVAQEAYMECWHAATTHPQTLPYAAFGICQVDVYENFSRFITPSEVVGPMISWDPTTEEMLRATMDIRVDETLPVEPEPGETARSFVVRATREKWRNLIGDKIDEWADCELVDNFTYTVFPNMMPWGGVHKIVYRFRPNGDDHRTCIMDVFLIGPSTDDEPPAPPEEIKLDADTPFAGTPGLGILGNVLDQDVFNMEKVQYGLETTVKDTVTFTIYQEDNIRWMHQLMDRYMEAD